MKKLPLFLFLFMFCHCSLFGQDYINITFRHYPIGKNVVRAFVPGSFNNWGPNSNGRIAVNAPSLMTYVDSLGFYVKTIRLKVGETYNYKFHEHLNSDGSAWQWYTDPLNPLINYSDNNNSILNVKKAMIFEISPKNDAIVSDAAPKISAGVFVAEGDSILLNQSTISLDGAFLSTLKGHIIHDLSILHYQLPPLKNGDHQIVINLLTQKGETSSESIRFTVAAGDLYFFTPSTDSAWAAQRIIRWRVNLGYTKLQSLTLKQLHSYPITLQPETEKDYEFRVNLSYGENRYVVSAMDTAGKVVESDTLKLVYVAPQAPQPSIVFALSNDRKKITLIGKANDPQNNAVSLVWNNQVTNVALLPNIDGRTEDSLVIDAPKIPGDYAVKLTVSDADGFSNSTVNFFNVRADSSVVLPNMNTVPNWVANARIYCVFLKSYTAAGTIKAAMNNLEHIKNMGFNVIWVLPVMDVEGIVDQGTNIGYNIIDFFHVEPAYGTESDFKDFVRRAHELGLRVILDVTPNHSSRSHPIALDVRSKKKFSRFYDFYQHQIIAHNDNGLGQSISADGIVYYSGFSDAILNWDWSDAEARQYMIDVYTYWLREYDIDGFRFDVYWGPHRRYGRANFDQPLRAALRAAKADIMLLGETDGTGVGTEVQFADQNGGMDMGYDWILKNAILNFPSITNLNDKLYNGGYRPGPNSFFLRFLENHDEDRVAYRYNSIEKTIPVSTAIFMATGIPLLYQGQEVGMGFGMGGGRDVRVRSTVNWQNPPARVLAPHYQKLAQIRAQFPAFRRQMEDRNGDGNINSSDATMQPVLKNSDGIYAYGRPYLDQNGLVVMNFTAQAKQFELALNLPGWAEFRSGFDGNRTYFLNNLYVNTSQAKLGAELERLTITLNPYEVAIYTISVNPETVQLPSIAVAVAAQEQRVEPNSFQLFDNYPNPFNSTTIIRYRLCDIAPQQTSIKILNILGQEIKTLVDEKQSAGDYRVTWDGLDNAGRSVASGVYLYSIRSGRYFSTKKLVIIK